MCEQEVALEFIKQQPNKSGLSENMIFLAERQCKDHKNTLNQLSSIKTDVESMKKIAKENSGKIDHLIELNSKTNFVENIKSILSNKVFLYILITLICYAFGESIGTAGLFLFGGK